MAPNIYEHLHHLDDDVVKDPGTTNERRKAEKKLKEIQSLIKKTSHTKEELDKLATEQHWKDIIDWFDNPKKTEETQKTIKNRLKRKREKEKRERQLEEILKQRRRREKEAEEQKRRHEEYRKQREEEEFRKQEQKRQEEEFRKQEQKRQEEESRKQEQKRQYLWSEFEALYRQNNDVNKTFRKLSMKYHPDKNIGKQEWAEANQKELTNIRDHYSKGLHLMCV
jgi:ATP-dependent Lon protease